MERTRYAKKVALSNRYYEQNFRKLPIPTDEFLEEKKIVVAFVSAALKD